MCATPFYCRTSSGECCSVIFFRGRVICPVSCNFAKRQSDISEGGYSLLDVFQVTFVTALVTNSIFPNMSLIPSPKSSTNTTTTLTTTQTFTTATTTTTSTTTTPSINAGVKNCPIGWSYYQTGLCYKYFSQKMNWYEAASHCKKEKVCRAIGLILSVRKTISYFREH